MKLIYILMLYFFAVSCSHVTFQSIDVTKDGELFISGIENSLFKLSQAVVVSCKHESKNDYKCKKVYPADSVDLYSNFESKREINEED